MALHNDPDWPRASAWLHGHPENPRLCVVGVPINRSVTPGSCHLAPAAIRHSLVKYSLYDFNTGSDLSDLAVRDCGDVSLITGSSEERFESISEQLKKPFASEAVVLLGGDNGVTRPGLRAMAAAKGLRLDQVGLLTLDAHLDLRTMETGPMNGNPVRGLLEDGLPGANIVQIGLQSFANSPAYAAFGKEAGILQITAEQCHQSQFAELFAKELDRLCGRVEAVYFDLDIDVMDRAFAPGCPGSRPGGLAPWQVRQAAKIAGRNPKVAAMDLVELDPSLDIHEQTSLSAAAFLLEFAAGILER